jgi:hypothetical protein
MRETDKDATDYAANHPDEQQTSGRWARWVVYCSMLRGTYTEYERSV